MKIWLSTLLVFAAGPFAVGVSLRALAEDAQPAQTLVTIDASRPAVQPETGYLHMGGSSVDGHTLAINSRYLVRDGKPWLPVMGEFHYSRYPEAEWEDEILKMKAAGVNIVSTYIFWIHHEEIEGQFDWKGRRDLRRFVELCGKHGMYVWIRVGPWAHGEVRNGGFPDWVARMPGARTNDPVYLHDVELFFDQIGMQVHGLMFKDGGPVIGVQLENEYGQHGVGRGSEHILKLKQLAMAAGIEAPFYSVTGWPSLDFPPHEVIPVSGGYPDGFWYDSQTNLPPSMTYLFNFNRQLGDMGATVKSEDPTGKVSLTHDPYFGAEEGGGMASSYRRRPVLSADDIAALTLTGIGSGINLYGYYMFHGGANPKGALSTLQESTATGYPNDLPEVTYDFGAPIGEFGQEQESYGRTRVLHLFLNAYGEELATMPAFAPAQRVPNAADTATPRAAVRSDGASGFLFVNNYVRQLAMPARHGFQAKIKLAGGEIAVPARPVDVPEGAYFAWPFRLALGHATLEYSTAQLLTRLDTQEGRLLVFFAVPGIAPEFSFAGTGLRGLTVGKATRTRRGEATVVRDLAPGVNSTIVVTDSMGAKTTLLLLTREQAEETAQLRIGGADHLALSASNLFFDGSNVHLRSTASPTQTVELLPEVRLRTGARTRNGLWTRYTFTQPAQHLELRVTQTQPGSPRAAMQMGEIGSRRKKTVAVVPPDASFEDAATWELRWKQPEMQGLSEVLLQMDYTGDVGRLSSSGTLLDDNFFHGIPWQVGLKRFPGAGTSSSLELQILPMPKVAPIYVDQAAHQSLDAADGAATLRSVRLIPEYESVVPVAP